MVKRHRVDYLKTDTIGYRKSHQEVQVNVEHKTRCAKVAKIESKGSRAMSVASARGSLQ
jgi:hypothetical protein